MFHHRPLTCGGFSSYSGPCGDCETCAPGRTEDERRELEEELAELEEAVAVRRDLIEDARAHGCSAPAIVYIELEAIEREAWDLENRLCGGPREDF